MADDEEWLLLTLIVGLRTGGFVSPAFLDKIDEADRLRLGCNSDEYLQLGLYNICLWCKKK